MATASAEEMPTSLAAVQAAGAETLSLDLSDAFEQFDPVDKQPAVSPGFGGPMSPASSQWPFRSPVMSPVPQSPLTFALSPGGVIRNNAKCLGIPLVLSGPGGEHPSVPVPVTSPSTVRPKSAVACTSPAGRVTTPSIIISSPATRAQGSSTQPVVRKARVSGSPLTMNLSPAKLGPQSPTGWQPLPSPGATIRQNAASFGIPLNLRSTCEAAVPIPVRSVAGAVVAPSPTTAYAPARTTTTFGGYVSVGSAQAPPQVVCASATAPVQQTANGRPVVLTQSGAAAPASSIRAIATPARRVNRGGA